MKASYPCMLQLKGQLDVGPSEGSRESSAAWPSAAAHIENSATTQRLKCFCSLQIVRPEDKLRLRAPCHAEPVYFKTLLTI